MVAPTTSWPCSTSRAAATELSTPPDMATRTFLRTAEHHGQLADLLHHGGEDADRPVDVGRGRLMAQAHPDRAQGQAPGNAHRGEHVGGFHRAGGTGRSARG